jgi:superfamily II DNA helicase RecQ
VIESEGAFSVHVRDEAPALAVSAASPVAVPEVAPIAAPSVVPVAAPEVAPVAAPSVAPVAASEVAPAVAPVVAASDGLFAKLAELRRELSVAANVPPYVVFNDKTLREMVDKLPQDLAAFGDISGVGKAKLEKYGDVFLRVIRGAAA